MMAAAFGPIIMVNPVAEVPDPDRVAVGVQDLLFAEAVLESRWRDDWLFQHDPKVTCELPAGK